MSAPARSPFEEGGPRACSPPSTPAARPGWATSAGGGRGRVPGRRAPHRAPRGLAVHQPGLAGGALVPGSRSPGPGPEERLASLPAPSGPRLVFANGRLRRGPLRPPGPCRPGAVVSSLAEALVHSPELVRPHLGPAGPARRASPSPPSTPPSSRTAPSCTCPPGAVLEAPIALVFAGGGAGEPVVHHPRVLVVAGQGARATVAEHLPGRRRRLPHRGGDRAVPGRRCRDRAREAAGRGRAGAST